MASPGEERRRKKRAPAAFMVHCRFGAPVQLGFNTWSLEGPALAMDLSEGGLSMDLESALPVSTKIRLTFSLMNERAESEKDRRRTFELNGEVRDCRPTPEKGFRLGVRFQSVSEEDRAFIAEYVRG